MYQREKAFLIKTAYLAAVLAVGWLILRYALVWLLPFLLALGFAALMEPAITLARRKLRLKRGFLAAVLTLALLALVIALGAVLVGQVIRQATDLMERLPELLSASGNHYPIVMVHGLFGWGGTEVLGLNYWGGFSSLRDILNNAGYEVYTPSIGPVASNWDRACELYAYLVGGTVDYGAYHSATNGHARPHVPGRPAGAE